MVKAQCFDAVTTKEEAKTGGEGEVIIRGR